MKKRSLCILLTFVMVVLVLGSCADSGGDSDNSVTQNPDATDTVVPDSEDIPANIEILDEFPDVDYGGYEFRILSRGLNYSTHWYAKDIYAEDETGDAINDAVYKRNTKVEEKYNIKIVNIPDDGDLSAIASRAVKAGDDQFDIVSHGLSQVIGLMSSGALYDLHSIPSINLSKPWWDQKAKEQLTMNGKLYATTSDYIILDKDATWIIMFNKQLLKDHGLEDPYQMVKDGTWTMDKMYEMMSAASIDLNGDGAMDENDQWGIVSQHYNAHAFFNAAGECISKINASSGQPEITMYSQRAIDVCEKIAEMQSNKNVTLNADDYTGKFADVWDGLQLGVFNTNRGLFYYAGMNRVTLLRDMETDFGIIPPPKFNNEQSDYCVAIHPGCTSSIAIPVTVENTERTGTILEALTAESKYTLLPAYYDISLKTKFARDDESQEMLDIIFANRIYDLGQVFSWGNAQAFYEQQLNKGTGNLTSYWEKNEIKITTAMQKTMDTLNNLES